MKYTSNLNLKKPESTESYSVEDSNSNSDILDAEVAGKADKNHASETAEFGAASAAKYGHVKLKSEISDDDSCAAALSAVYRVQQNCGWNKIFSQSSSGSYSLYDGAPSKGVASCTVDRSKYSELFVRVTGSLAVLKNEDYGTSGVGSGRTVKLTACGHDITSIYVPGEFVGDKSEEVSFCINVPRFDPMFYSSYYNKYTDWDFVINDGLVSLGVNCACRNSRSVSGSYNLKLEIFGRLAPEIE